MQTTQSISALNATLMRDLRDKTEVEEYYANGRHGRVAYRLRHLLRVCPSSGELHVLSVRDCSGILHNIED